MRVAYGHLFNNAVSLVFFSFYLSLSMSRSILTVFSCFAFLFLSFQGDDEARPERFKKFLSFFPKYEMGVDTTVTVLPFPLAKEFVYESVGDVLMDLEEEERTTHLNYSAYEIMKPIGKIKAKNFVAVLVYVDVKSTFEVGEGSVLITYSKEGEIIDYRYWNMWSAIPKAGGELSTDYSADWTGKWSFDYTEVNSSFFHYDLDEEELKMQEVIENEYTGKTVHVSDSLLYECFIQADGEIRCQETRSVQDEEQIVYY